MWILSFKNWKVNTLPSKKYTNWVKLIYFSLVLREREEKKPKYFAPYSISNQSNDSIYSQDCRVVQWLVGRWGADSWNSVALLYDYKKRNKCPRLYHLPFNGAKSCPKSFFYNRAFSLRILKEFRLTKVSLLNYQKRGFINS